MVGGRRDREMKVETSLEVLTARGAERASFGRLFDAGDVFPSSALCR